MDTNMIPTKTYKKIVELVPLVCVDIILKHKDKYILVKRDNNPLKGHWWLVGGREFKDERLVRTAKRKVKEEAGLNVLNLEVIGIYEDSYKKSAFGVPTHSVSVIFKGEVKIFKPNEKRQCKEISLFDKLPPRFVKHLICLK